MCKLFSASGVVKRRHVLPDRGSKVSKQEASREGGERENRRGEEN